MRDTLTSSSKKDLCAAVILFTEITIVLQCAFNVGYHKNMANLSPSLFICARRSDLATVQEQYVALCHEKEKLSSKLEEVERENLSSVQAALDKVHTYLHIHCSLIFVCPLYSQIGH